ncbi:MAG: hypothetical protein HYR91_07180 [Flavobacteriia bacterium]|nr:hypothetical protein [Flavobacteriia bacterium]
MKSLFYSLLFLVFVSCTSNKNQESNEISPIQGNPSSIENEAEVLIAQTDMNEKLLEVGSLYYTKEDGSSYEINALVNSKKKIVKITEIKVIGKTGQFFKTIFYFKNNKKIVSNEHFEKKIASKSSFIERITYYDKNEKPAISKIREALFEEELDRALFTQINPIDCSVIDAQNALNQEGKFITTFQGFVESGQQLFLTIGENTKEGYISALLVQYKDSNIKKLQENEMLMLGKKLRVNFEKMTDQSGFQFQILTGITFIEE